MGVILGIIAIGVILYIGSQAVPKCPDCGEFMEPIVRNYTEEWNVCPKCNKAEFVVDHYKSEV